MVAYDIFWSDPAVLEPMQFQAHNDMFTNIVVPKLNQHESIDRLWEQLVQGRMGPDTP